MATPKPMAPTKPLTFTPPVFLKGETKSSELPAVENAEPNVISKKPARKSTGKKFVKNKGQRPNIVIVDETTRADGGVVLTLGEAVAFAAEATKEFTKNFKKKPAEKKPFVLDEHLTQRPFHDDRLKKLKADLQRNS